MAANTEVQKYYDALLASYDIVVDAIAKTNERGFKVTKQLVSEMAKGQRETLELGRKLAAEPTQLANLYGVMLETTTAAQGRALTFAQTAYQEAFAAGSDARTAIEKLTEVNKETATAAMEMARRYATSNPIAQVVQRTMESVSPKTKSAAAG